MRERVENLLREAKAAFARATPVPEPQPEVAYAPKPANFAGWKDQLDRLEAIIHELAGECLADSPEDRAWAIINEMQEGFDDVVETETILDTPAQPEVAADLIDRCAAQIEPGIWPMLDEQDRNLHRAIAKRILAIASPPVVEEAVKAENYADLLQRLATGKGGRQDCHDAYQTILALLARSATP